MTRPVTITRPTRPREDQQSRRFGGAGRNPRRHEPIAIPAVSPADFSADFSTLPGQVGGFVGQLVEPPPRAHPRRPRNLIGDHQS
jgi:hypothetical protein